MNLRRGTSLIDLIISIAIIAILFGGIYLVYFSIITAIGTINVRSAAATVAGQEIETIRNLSYDSIGTVGGAPAGIIPQVQSVVSGNTAFTLKTTVRNIDDPFDGVLGGNPNDLAPADYKLVSVEVVCPTCNSPVDLVVTTTVAPKGLESATQNGSLFIYAIDANGNPVQDANIHIVNASVTPSIDLTDTTNASGVLELVEIPTSTQNYAVTVTKAGYSTAQTYSPNHLTVVRQTVTNATFAIDRLSQLTVYTSDNRCRAVNNEPFAIQGSKLISTNPNVFKFSTSTATGASGTKSFSNLEWDAYSIWPTDGTRDLVGTIPLNPIAVNPSSSPAFRLISQTAADPALLVTVVDSVTGAGIPSASVSLSKGAFSSTLVTNQIVLSQTNWSGSGETGYADQSGAIDMASIPGAITLLLNASGTYDTNVTSTLTSNTFDLGGTNSTFSNITWDPAVQPSQTGAGSLSFQVAANNDAATWNYVGPDGTADSYFTSPGALPASLAGNRYFRYRVFLTTADQNTAPELDDISFGFSADCVPPAQVIFSSLSGGSYHLDVTAQNYFENSSTVSVASGFQSSTMQLVHL